MCRWDSEVVEGRRLRCLMGTVRLCALVVMRRVSWVERVIIED